MQMLLQVKETSVSADMSLSIKMQMAETRHIILKRRKVFTYSQGSRVPAEGCRYRYAYRQMDKCRYRTIRTGGLGLIILIYWGKGYLA
jgi:hypothetical protein